jgi:hypothetical protein
MRALLLDPDMDLGANLGVWKLAAVPTPAM